MSAGVLYGVDAWGGSRAPIVHGPGVALALGGGGRSLRVGARLSARYVFPLDIDARLAGARLEQGLLRLLAIVEVRLGARVWLALGAGGGADLVHVAPRVDTSAGAVANPAATIVDPMASALAALELAASSTIRFDLLASLDVDPVGRRYVVERNGATEVAFEPWRLRPGLALAMTFELLR